MTLRRLGAGFAFADGVRISRYFQYMPDAGTRQSIAESSHSRHSAKSLMCLLTLFFCVLLRVTLASPTPLSTTDAGASSTQSLSLSSRTVHSQRYFKKEKG